MKLKQHQFSIQPRIFEGSTYQHPWYEHNERLDREQVHLIRPNPPSREAVERAKFIDKTYEWKGRPSSIRSRD